MEGDVEEGFGFSSVFCGLSPWSLTRKPIHNKTCNPTYNPSYCPHTSVVARGGRPLATLEQRSYGWGKHGGEGKGAQRGESR